MKLSETRTYYKGLTKYQRDLYIYRAIELQVNELRKMLIAKAGIMKMPLSVEAKTPEQRAEYAQEWAKYFNVHPALIKLWDAETTTESVMESPVTAIADEGVDNPPDAQYTERTT